MTNRTVIVKSEHNGSGMGNTRNGWAEAQPEDTLVDGNGAAILTPTEQHYGEAYIATPTATALANQGTFYITTATTWASGQLEGFTRTNGRLTYTHTDTIIAHVHATISASADTTEEYQWMVYKNGSPVASSVQQRQVTSAGQNGLGCLAIHCLTSLSTGNYIEVYCSAEGTDTVELTMEAMNLMVTA